MDRRLLPLLLAACGDTSLSALSAGAAADGGTPPRASVIFVLTDDLSWNLIPFMPHVQSMQRKGTTFSRYFVTDSLCCPSRSSIFTGRYPHDTTVFKNGGADGGYAQFERAGNATVTFANALHGGGYATAMMGKYLNGYEPAKNQADPGWSEWDVAGSAYRELDYELNQNGALKKFGHAPGDYLTDVLAGLGLAFVHRVGAQPFLLEIATFAPHDPYTPAPADVGTFHEVAPRTPAFGRANANPPRWLARHGPLPPLAVQNLDAAFTLRVEAVQAVDRMLAALMKDLAASGRDRSTYLIFSSDNGLHLGEHDLNAGKMTAFDSDINVPLVVVGPGVPAGATVDAITENIDLCPTFTEIAGVPAPPTSEGRSLLPLFHGARAADWREAALIEHHGPDLAPPTSGDPDNEPVRGSQPNSYEAIRLATSVYVEYQDGETEYYDLATDPDEMTNTAASLSAEQVRSFHATIAAIRGCHDAASCWAAQKLAH